MSSKLFEKKGVDSSVTSGQIPKDELPEEIPKKIRKNASSKTRKRMQNRKSQAAFLQRKKEQGLLRKYVWVKLPKEKLRKFADWITIQDPDALCGLVERGSPNDLKYLWEQQEKIDK